MFITLFRLVIFQTLTKLEYTFVNCSKNISVAKQQQPDAKESETYYEKDMVRKPLIIPFITG